MYVRHKGFGREYHGWLLNAVCLGRHKEGQKRRPRMLKEEDVLVPIDSPANIRRLTEMACRGLHLRGG